MMAAIVARHAVRRQPLTVRGLLCARGRRQSGPNTAMGGAAMVKTAAISDLDFSVADMERNVVMSVPVHVMRGFRNVGTSDAVQLTA